MTLCPLEYVRPEVDRHVLRCPVCDCEVRSKYADPSMRKQQCGVVRTGRGVGDELLDLLKEHGIKQVSKCDCAVIRRQMNQLGPEGCRKKAASLVKLVAAGWSIPEGATLSITALVELAIVRAEARAADTARPDVPRSTNSAAPEAAG